MSHPVLRPGTAGRLEELGGDVCACVHGETKDVGSRFTRGLQQNCSQLWTSATSEGPSQTTGSPLGTCLTMEGA